MTGPDPDRLVSWKRIAAYLRCSERTARRWRAEDGLPVHNAGGPGGSVHAFKSELDDWIRTRPDAVEKDAAEKDEVVETSSVGARTRPEEPTAPMAGRVRMDRTRASIGLAAFIAAVAAGLLMLRSGPDGTASLDALPPAPSPPAPLSARRAAGLSDAIAIGEVAIDGTDDGQMARRLAVSFAEHGFNVLDESRADTATWRIDATGRASESGAEIALSLRHQQSGAITFSASHSTTRDELRGAARSPLDGATRTAAALMAQAALCLFDIRRVEPAFQVETLGAIARWCATVADEDRLLSMTGFAKEILYAEPENLSAKAIVAGAIAGAVFFGTYDKFVGPDEGLDYADALTSEVLAAAPDHKIALAAQTLSALRRNSSDWSAAVSTFENAEKRHLSMFGLPTAHARTLNFLGSRNAALKKYIAYLGRHPLDAIARSEAAALFAQGGNYAIARDHFEKAFSDNPNIKVAPWLYIESAVFYGPPGEAAALIAGPVGEGAQLNDLQRRCFDRYLALRRKPDNEALRDAVLSTCDQLESWHRFRLLAALDETDRAFSVFLKTDGPEKANADGRRSGLMMLLFLAGLPEADDVRTDPRFWAIAQELGLVSFWRDHGPWPDFCHQPSADCALTASRLATR